MNFSIFGAFWRRTLGGVGHSVMKHVIYLINKEEYREHVKWVLKKTIKREDTSSY